MSKLHWSIDSLVLRDNVVFGFGWLFHEETEIENLKLLIRLSDNCAECNIAADYGKTRSDVANVFNNYDNAKNTGFVIYGSCLCGVDEGVRVFLEGSFANGDVFNLEVPMASLVNLKGNSRKAERELLTQLFKRGFQLLKQGQISTLIDKVRRYLKRRSKSYPDSVEVIYSNLMDNERKNIVFLVDHDLGGGANLYRERLVADKICEGKTVFILSYHVGSLTYVLTVRNNRLDVRYSISGIDFVSQLAQILPFQEVLYNTAVSFIRPEEIPQLLVVLKAQCDCQLTLLVHDFFMVCPSHFLLDDHGAFCQVPSISRCQQCLTSNQQGFATLFSFREINLWRRLWGTAIQAADSIIVFSRSSLQLLSKAYPGIDKTRVSVKPHKVDYLQSGPIKPSYTEALRIGVVGQIGYHKGARFVQELSQEIKIRGYQTKIVVIGSIEAKCDSSIVKQTGLYQHDRLPSLIQSSGVNIILFPSICPETFSYVIQEIMLLELPIACFDMGAPAERIATYPKGRILKNIDVLSVLDDLIDFHKKIYLLK